MRVRAIRARLATQSMGMLFLLTLLADVVVFGGGIPLGRFSLIAAADKSSSALLIATLLAANIALLGVLTVAMLCNSLLITRVVRWLAGRSRTAYVRVERGEIETAARRREATPP